MSYNSKQRLYCSLFNDTFEFTEHDILPARCEGCPKVSCVECMKQRVRDNINRFQLELPFEGASR